MIASNLKKLACDIFAEAVKAADPYSGVGRAVHVTPDGIMIACEMYPSDRFTRVIVVGAGKASARMGQGLEDILGERITEGWINTKDDHSLPLKRVTVHECGHPVPDSRGIEGSKRISELLSAADEHTLVIGLLSGGGSALMPSPADGVTLDEIQTVTRFLLNAGASIGELNAVRKHLSVLKGGGMARLASPAKLHMLILSDVIGDRLDTIASGPAVADETTFDDCVDICRQYDMLHQLPPGVRDRLHLGVSGGVSETAKTGDDFLESVVNTLIGNNAISVEAARLKADELGFNTHVLSTTLEGEASKVGTFFASMASEIKNSGEPISAPACIIAGGETTVTITGDGKGGRNQEMALSAAITLDGSTDTAFLSGGTDGTDGPTDAAGGVVDGGTVASGTEKSLEIRDYLENNDSYHYLKEVDGLVMTGPTGTNVMDIQVLLVGKK